MTVDPPGTHGAMQPAAPEGPAVLVSDELPDLAWDLRFLDAGVVPPLGMIGRSVDA